MKKLLLLPFLLFSLYSFTQVIHDGLEFSRTELNFRQVQNWISSVDSIEVTNLTAKKIFLLKQKYPREFEVRFPAAGVDPGKSIYIEIVYKPSGRGRFDQSLQLFHSASQTPVTITYKGEVLSFDEFSEVACPSFSKPNLQPVSFELEVTVLDSATNKPLGSSFLEISIGEFYSQHRTDVNGKYSRRSTINYYVILAEHPGYQGRYVAKHINPKNRKIVIALPPLLQSVSTPTAVVATPSVVLTPPSTPTVTAITTPSTSVAPPAPPGTSFSLSEYKRNNIVFLIDKSSSMNKPDCMPLLQMAMTELAKTMRAEDRVTIITYANEARIVLPGTPGNEHEKMIAVIQQLKCGGRTEGGKAIHTAYKNAEENFIKGGVNQIIIATDGGFNGISENETELMQLVSAKLKQDIKLSVLAFGENRYGKAHIQRLAKQGEGFYEFIATPEDAERKFTETIKAQSKIK